MVFFFFKYVLTLQPYSKIKKKKKTILSVRQNDKLKHFDGVHRKKNVCPLTSLLCIQILSNYWKKYKSSEYIKLTLNWNLRGLKNTFKFCLNFMWILTFCFTQQTHFFYICQPVIVILLSSVRQVRVWTLQTHLAVLSSLLAFLSPQKWTLESF